MSPLNDTGVRPVQRDVLVRRIRGKDRTEGGLYVPQGSETWEPIGVVLDVGPGVENPDIVAGATVLFKNRPSSALIPDDREGGRAEWERVVRLREEDILAVVENVGVAGVEQG